MRTPFLALLLLATACASPSGSSIEQQRANARSMRTEALEQFYGARPGLRSAVQGAAGYAVFSSVNVQLLLVGGGQGYGIAHDNRSGRDTYMSMAQLGLGIGAGAKDFRVLFVFDNEVAYRRFVEEGWEFGADADAAVIADERGVQGGVAGTVGSGGASAGASGSAGSSAGTGARANATGAGFQVYQLTVNGLALKAMLNGTKYWQDRALN